MEDEMDWMAVPETSGTSNMSHSPVPSSLDTCLDTEASTSKCSAQETDSTKRTDKLDRTDQSNGCKSRPINESHNSEEPVSSATHSQTESVQTCEPSCSTPSIATVEIPPTTNAIVIEATTSVHNHTRPSIDVREGTQPEAESCQSASPQPTGSGRTHRYQSRRPFRRQRRNRLVEMYPEITPAVPVRGQSFCRCPLQVQSRDLQCRCGEDNEIFEWVWNEDNKTAGSMLQDNDRDVRFHINYSSGTAAVRGTQPMSNRQYFWEIKMTTPVYGTDMMVGVGTDSVDLNAYRYTFCSLLGRDADSWGLSYYGRLQHKGVFKDFTNARFGQGSIIGAHLDMWHGTLTFYKNRQPAGVAYTGLSCKTLFPMVCSTAARTGMRLIKACSFQTSLQFLCCQALRKQIPAHLDVITELKFPPGLQAFLANNLSWLLRPSELQADTLDMFRGPSSAPRKRRRLSRSESDSAEDFEDSDGHCESDDSDSGHSPHKRRRPSDSTQVRHPSSDDTDSSGAEFVQNLNPN